MRTYAAYTETNVRNKCSSGGIFPLLAKVILKEKGIVYGVRMSSDCKRAEYVRIDREQDLPLLLGSKYIQADMGDSFWNIKADLNNKKTVLFTGCGCQVNGLKKFLGKDYSNLYCMDVICHGVPSPKLWEMYVQYQQDRYESKLIQVNFRCKDYGWNKFGIKRSYQNKKSCFTPKSIDPYMVMFLDNLSLRPSCYNCVAKTKKLSDISVGDFWGIDKIMPSMNDGQGVSAVIIRSDKGKELWDFIKEKLVYSEVRYEDVKLENMAEYKSVPCPSKREEFFYDLNRLNFEQLNNKYGVSTREKILFNIKSAVKRTLAIFRKDECSSGGHGLIMDCYLFLKDKIK